MQRLTVSAPDFNYLSCLFLLLPQPSTFQAVDYNCHLPPSDSAMTSTTSRQQDPNPKGPQYLLPPSDATTTCPKSLEPTHAPTAIGTAQNLLPGSSVILLPDMALSTTMANVRTYGDDQCKKRIATTQPTAEFTAYCDQINFEGECISIQECPRSDGRNSRRAKKSAGREKVSTPPKMNYAVVLLVWIWSLVAMALMGSAILYGLAPALANSVWWMHSNTTTAAAVD